MKRDRFIRVVLVGFMGAGKTTVGKLLAPKLRSIFIDLDDEIVDVDGRSVSQIFEESGESGFRVLEAFTLRSLVTELDCPEQDRVMRWRRQTGFVLAVGGGAFVREENATLLRQYGWRSIFLDAPVEELYRRCNENNARPLARDANLFRQLYEARRGSYMEAELRVETGGKTPQQIVEHIVNSVLQGSGGGWNEVCQ